MYDIFTALKMTDYNDVKVMILGQDPYHGENQAHGLAFSVKEGVTPPPSLVNIFKELKNDLGCNIPQSGNLASWANEGVLLLNTTLTVRAAQPNSHKDIGWQLFTDKIISLLNEREKPLVFILWGANAKTKIPLITSPQHLVLTAAHPSPLSSWNGFFGCRHFSKANTFLIQNNIDPVNWQL
jgi:uracil-DNA glycosylase